MTTPSSQRPMFDAAVQSYRRGDTGSARAQFRAITEAMPGMSDAWLGRMACGDHDLATIEGLHANSRSLYRETRRLGIEDGTLHAMVATPLYLTMPVWSRATTSVALASALIVAGRYDEALAALHDDELRADARAAQWVQYVTAALYHRTQRWPDVLEVTQAIPCPSASPTYPEVTAATIALRGAAQAAMGEFTEALATLEAPSSGIECVRANVALTRGWCLREQGDEAAATAQFRTALVDGELLDGARQALDNPAYRLVCTDAESVASRTDRWDPATECSAADRQEQADGARRAEMLAAGRALLADQVGLDEVKRAVAELEDQIEVRALRLAHGLPVAGQTNHMLLVGPPGTGKTTTATALGMIYAGLGIVEHPEIIEVRRADFCGEHIGASGPKTNELIARSLGRILFMDEFYSLVERHHDGRPDMIGMEAVNQLLIALEAHRFDFCFIGAGYEREVDEFLTVNPGLAGRFNRKLRFASYTPEELVEIAVRYGTPRATVLPPEAQKALLAACSELAGYRAPDGAHGIDVMQNGRFARNVLERAERLRDSRVAAQHRGGGAAVTVEDLQTVTGTDIAAAVAECCAEKHVPVGLGSAG